MTFIRINPPQAPAGIYLNTAEVVAIHCPILGIFNRKIEIEFKTQAGDYKHVADSAEQANIFLKEHFGFQHDFK